MTTGYKPFAAQVIRLALLIVAILVGRAGILLLPMVRELETLPGLGISADMLVSALAYTTILLLLVSFTKSIEISSAESTIGFPWQSMIGQLFVLAGVVFAYRALADFAAVLLGRHFWVYSVVLLLLACVPIYQLGKLAYQFVSRQLERWEG